MNRWILDVLGLNIKMYREAKNITRHELSKLVYVPRQTVIDVEAGRKGMNVTSLPDYANALDVTVSELLIDRRPRK